MALTLVTAPTTLVVSVNEFRQQARLSTTQEDALITRLLRVAQGAAERELRRALLTQTWRVTSSAFPCDRAWRLPKPPLQSVTSVTYRDGTGAVQTMSVADYVVDAPSAPTATHGRVVLADGKEWPIPGVVHPHAAAVEYVCGYGAAVAVPDEIKHGIILLAAHYYEHREPTVLGTIATDLARMFDTLWGPFRAQVWQ